MKIAATIIGLALACASATAGELKFTKAPTAKKAGDKTVITFAVSAETDVAVYILGAKGKTVRHLAAGVLGDNAPAPLKPGLSQSIEWGGKDDDGKAATGGPFRAKVVAGMTPKHDGFVFEKPDAPYTGLRAIYGIGVRSDGGIFALVHRGHRPNYGPFEIQSFSHEGNYEGTLLPFGGHMPFDDLSGLNPLKSAEGRPLLRYLSFSFRKLPYLPKLPMAQTLLVDDEDNLRMLVVQFDFKGSKLGITKIGPDGKVPGDSFDAPLTYGTPIGRPSKDEEIAVTGSDADPDSCLIAGVSESKSRKLMHAIFKAPLAGGEMKVLFGDPAVAGDDKAHLNEPLGLATDGKGNVYVADTGNDRVVVFEEKNAKFLAEIKVPKPYWVGVHKPTGAIYVHSAPKGVGEVIKYAGFKKPGIKSRLPLPGVKSAARARTGRDRLWVLALDANAKVPRLWMGQLNNDHMLKLSQENQLAWCDDLGDRFSDIEPVVHTPVQKWRWQLTTDPSHRYVMYGDRVIDDHTGEVTQYKGGLWGTSKIGPDGLVYSMHSGRSLRRFTMEGKMVPFSAVKPGRWKYRRDETGRPFAYRELAEKENGYTGGARMKGELVEWGGEAQGLPTCPSGTSGNERDFTLDRQGNIYVKNRSRYYHRQMTVDVYDKEGAWLRTAIYECTDGAYGPRVDAVGNIYMIEGVSRPEGNAPKELNSLGYANSYYGSLVKLGPEGGAFWLLSPKDYLDSFGFKRPELKLKEKTVTMIHPVSKKLVKDQVIAGVKWWRPGFSVYQSVRGGSNCHCYGHLFDTDDFGRSFLPDALMYQVGVMDTAGNEILRFGSYGNRDNRGPYSWVRDPKTNVLRPRKDSDPKDLVSPYAEPEFAFAYLASVVVTDRNIYASDLVNGRLMRIKLEYQAEAEVKL